MKKEQWKDIPGYDGFYQISNLGRFRSRVPCSRNITGDWRVRPVYTSRTGDSTYVRVGFGNIPRIRVRVDALVSNAFVPNPHNSPDIEHIDGDTGNNCSSNLNWIVPKDYASEIWKNIKGFKGKYQISNLGRIRGALSLSNSTPNGKFRLISCSTLKGKYRVTTITRATKKEFLLIGRTVLTTFRPSKNKNLLVVHVDGNTLNDRLDNLKWDTPKRTLRTRKSLDTKNLGKSPAKERPVYQIDTLTLKIIKRYRSVLAASRHIGVNSGHISRVCNGTRNTCKGYIWKYVKENKPKEKTGFLPTPVTCIDVCTGEAIKTYRSIGKAAKELNLSRDYIGKCCCNDNYTAGEYKWRYATAEEIEDLNKPKRIGA